MDAGERMRPDMPLNTVDFRGMSRLIRTRLDRKMERVAGIEPAYSAWKAAALPLCYTRAIKRRVLDRGSDRRRRPDRGRLPRRRGGVNRRIGKPREAPAPLHPGYKDSAPLRR